MKNERYLLSNVKRVVLCERHSQKHDIVDDDLEQNLGETNKPCHDCQSAMQQKNEVRAAIADVMISCYDSHSSFELADALQQRLDALIDHDLLRVAIHEK